MRKKTISKEILIELYINQEMSIIQIAKQLNIGKKVVSRCLEEYEIPKRDKFAYIVKYTKEIKESTQIELVCENCKTKFFLKPSLANRPGKHFCCAKCANEYRKGKPGNKPKTGEIVKCDWCGEEHYKNRYLIENFKKHFCNEKCRKAWEKENAFKGENNPKYNRIKTNCSYCGKVLLLTPSAYNKSINHYCNMECMSKDYIGKVYGENHPSWKGGYNKIYYGPNWKRIRKEVQERDNHTCQRCGITSEEIGHELPVHHIKPIRTFDSWEEANVLDNLISLCPTCHGIVENSGIDFEINNKECIVQTTTLSDDDGLRN